MLSSNLFQFNWHQRRWLLIAIVTLLILATFTVVVQANDSDSAAATTTSTDTSSTTGEVEVDVDDDKLPDIPAAKKDGSPPSKNDEPISLARTDFCRACHSVVEEFHKWTVRNFNDPSSRRNTTMSRGELVEWFCRSGEFAGWKEPLMWGCIKTVQDHHDDVLQPFLGTHTSHEYTTLGQVYRHKIASCVKIDACDPSPIETRPKNDCESCDRLVRDIHWSLDREQKINKTIVEKTLRVICMEVGMRHEKPMEVEAFCHEYVDEHWYDTQKMLVKVYNDPNIPRYERINAIKKRFCGGMTEVCEEERKQMADEIKARKEEEKKARIAAREARKIGGKKTPPVKTEEKDEL